jgi:hypothetical protein
MVRKTSILIAIIISAGLLLASAKFGAVVKQDDQNPIEYSWDNNYLINSFCESAIDDPEDLPGGSYLKYVIPFCRFSFFDY